LDWFRESLSDEHRSRVRRTVRWTSDGESEDCDAPAEAEEAEEEEVVAEEAEEAEEAAEVEAVRAFFIELLGEEDGQRAGGAIKLRPKRGVRLRLSAVRQSWEVLVELMGAPTATAYVRRSPKMLVGRPQTLRQAWAEAVQVGSPGNPESALCELSLGKATRQLGHGSLAPRFLANFLVVPHHSHSSVSGGPHSSTTTVAIHTAWRIFIALHSCDLCVRAQHASAGSWGRH
jgi:hypothetical protein